MKKNDTTYIIQFPGILIPALETILPEIEVNFKTQNGTIFMESGAWVLKSSTNEIIKDSRFMSSFDIILRGQLSLEPSHSYENIVAGTCPPTQLIVASGWVDYQVQGKIPRIFRSAPQFFLTSTIQFIQNCAADFVTKQFSKKLLSSFKAFNMKTVANAFEETGRS